MIDGFRALIPQSVLGASGAVFYSGRAAFSAPSPLYILGLNPGGDPLRQANDTVAKHTNMVLNEKPHNWSEYKDESWREGHKTGTSGMQPRILYLLGRLGVDPQKTPASNVVFVRSAREKDIASTFNEVARECWRFHETVIERLHVRLVLCFGQRAGNWVCGQLGATTFVDEFIEENERKWRSSAFKNAHGITVVVATHPSIADWTNRQTDPSELVRRMLEP